MIHFDRVEVVNRLNISSVLDTVRLYGPEYDKLWVFDKVHHEVNQFCSVHTLQEVYIDLFDNVDEALKTALQKDCTDFKTGIEIIAIRVTKPKIPDAIRRNYELMEGEKTRLLVAHQQQKVVEKEAETERKRATIEAQKDQEVARIRKEQEVMEKEAEQKMSSIGDQMHLAQQKARTDAKIYSIQQEADANKALLTAEYLQLQRIVAVGNNTKVYFGEKIPTFFSDNAGAAARAVG